MIPKQEKQLERCHQHEFNLLLEDDDVIKESVENLMYAHPDKLADKIRRNRMTEYVVTDLWEQARQKVYENEGDYL